MDEKEIKIKKYNRVVSIISVGLIIAGLAITFSAIFGAYSLLDSGIAGMSMIGFGVGFAGGFAQAEQRIIRLYSVPSSMSSPQQKIYCSSCGQPLTYIEQYKRWYCNNENKYV